MKERSESQTEKQKERERMEGESRGGQGAGRRLSRKAGRSRPGQSRWFKRAQKRQTAQRQNVWKEPRARPVLPPLPPLLPSAFLGIDRAAERERVSVYVCVRAMGT